MKEEKKEEQRQKRASDREKNNEGKLLKQLQVLQERIERMTNDNDRYCLLSSEKGPDTYTFKVMKDNDPKLLTIKVDPKFRVTCSCMDFAIQTRKLSIPCKHIVYLLNKILQYELFEYYDNTIKMPKLFVCKVNDRIFVKREKYTVKKGDKF